MRLSATADQQHVKEAADSVAACPQNAAEAHHEEIKPAYVPAKALASGSAAASVTFHEAQACSGG